VFEAKKAKLEEVRTQFEQEFSHRSKRAKELGEVYLKELQEFLTEYEASAAVNPILSRMDSTGMMSREADFAEWVLKEQRRVLAAFADLV
jgi:hypothetical protein